MPPQNDKVDREGRKSLKVVVPTQADSDENGIDLDDHVMQNFSQIFGIERETYLPRLIFSIYYTSIRC